MVTLKALPEEAHIVVEFGLERSPFFPEVGLIGSRLQSLYIEVASEEYLNWGDNDESVEINMTKVSPVDYKHGKQIFTISEKSHPIFYGQYLLFNDNPANSFVELSLISIEIEGAEEARIDIDPAVHFILVRIGANETKDKIDIEIAEVHR